MEKKKRELREAGSGELRRKAEERLKEKPAPPKKLPELETQELIQELRVHQIELEMQNEELRRTQAVVEESRAKYSDLYDFAPVGYLTLNRQGIILEANLTACSSLGKERSLLISINNLFTNFIIKKGEKDLFYQHLGKVFEAKSLETCELELKGKGNTKFYAQLQSIVVKDNLSQCRTAIIDITERKRAEEYIKKQNEFVETITHSLQYPLYVIDTDYTIILSNNKAKERGIVEGDRCYQVTHRLQEPCSSEHICPLKEVIRTGKPIVTEHVHFDNDGNCRNFEVHGDPILDKDGQVIQMIEYSIDITERKQAEEALKKANEKLKKLDQLKTDFVSTVSHELRTPLSIIKEGISLVLDKTAGEINEKQEQLLSVTKANIDRLARIIGELLDISKIEAGKVVLKRELINLDEMIKIVESAFGPQIKERGIELRTIISDKSIEIYADKDKLTQIFANLINNSLKFTEKGYIEIKVKKLENEVEFSVADTGRGISKEDMPKVFSKFQQFGRIPGQGDRGTGLGLSIVRELVELHNGRIRVESEIGKGTKFTFVLPRYSYEKVFKEHIDRGIKEASEKNAKMSIIMGSLINLDRSREDVDLLLKDIEDVIRKSLRRAGDIVIKGTEEVVILVDCDKDNVLIVKKRLIGGISEYLNKKGLKDKIKLQFGYATYPDDGMTEEELTKKAKKNNIALKDTKVLQKARGKKPA